jgi:hypothetical protein
MANRNPTGREVLDLSSPAAEDKVVESAVLDFVSESTRIT